MLRKPCREGCTPPVRRLIWSWQMRWQKRRVQLPSFPTDLERKLRCQVPCDEEPSFRSSTAHLQEHGKEKQQLKKMMGSWWAPEETFDGSVDSPSRGNDPSSHYMQHHFSYYGVLYKETERYFNLEGLSVFHVFRRVSSEQLRQTCNGLGLGNRWRHKVYKQIIQGKISSNEFLGRSTKNVGPGLFHKLSMKNIRFSIPVENTFPTTFGNSRFP